MQTSSKKVIVGMSGGVDSSDAALLLLQQGYMVEGLFMKNWEEDDSEEYCSAAKDVADAQGVCAKLGIKLHTVNFAAEYWDNVFSNFLAEYKAGRTPNPDILCNREIKFKAFLEYAQHLGADYIATGHYAAKIDCGDAVLLAKAQDSNKDQSYFLYALKQEQLQYALFPLAHISKPEVRKLAAAAGYANYAKKDSTGICFIGERKFKQFLQTYLPAQPGEIVTENNKVIGQHEGLMYYTIGQRQGIGIGGIADASRLISKLAVESKVLGEAERRTGMYTLVHADSSTASTTQFASTVEFGKKSHEPWFVLDKDIATNRLIVGQRADHPRLFAPGLAVQQLSWIQQQPDAAEFTCTAKIRYRQPDQECKVFLNCHDNTAKVMFTDQQRAITPGQSIVFYNHDICLGGGIIEERIWKI